MVTQPRAIQTNGNNLLKNYCPRKYTKAFNFREDKDNESTGYLSLGLEFTISKYRVTKFANKKKKE